jgi:hypothetical protein
MALVTYEQAVRHLKQEGVLDGSPADADLTLKIEQASAMVIAHLKRPAEFDVDTIPADDPDFAWVQAAVLRTLGWLYRFRGDDPEAPSFDDLMRNTGSSMHRDPSLA